MKKSIFIIILILLFALIIGLSLNRKKITTESKASWDICRCFDPTHCYEDQCTRNVVKAPNVCYDYPDDGPLPMDASPLCTHIPPCCIDMVERNNSQICCWIERAFCLPSQCKQLTNNRDNCGWYWSDHGIPGYGCTTVNQPVIQPTTIPSPTLKPTKPFAPTATSIPPSSSVAKPTLLPTNTTTVVPIIKPTQTSTPLNINSQPTNKQSVEKQSAPFQSPSLNIPIIKLETRDFIIKLAERGKITGYKIKYEASKILDIPKIIFLRLTYYDRLLEDTINGFFLK